MTNAKEILTTARKQNIAVPAFNVGTLEATQAVFAAASEVKLPLMVEASKSEIEHIGASTLVAICESLAKQTGVSYCLHLDRGNDLPLMKRVLDAGFNSISADFGETYERNLELTVQARELTARYDAQLEGGMEYVPYVGYSKMKEGDLEYTDPQKAAQFVEATKVDSLIVSIGTQSGKFKEISEIRYHILDEVRSLLPGLPLVLHGGSFLDEQVVKTAIEKGINKINLNSELRLAFTERLQANIASRKEEYAPHKLMEGAVEQMKIIAAAKLRLYARL